MILKQKDTRLHHKAIDRLGSLTDAAFECATLLTTAIGAATSALEQTAMIPV
jgi:hypothetical protein